MASSQFDVDECDSIDGNGCTRRDGWHRLEAKGVPCSSEYVPPLCILITSLLLLLVFNLLSPSLPPSPPSTDGGRHRQAGHPGVHRPGGQLRLPRSDERTGAARYRDEGIIIIYLRSVRTAPSS